MSVAARAWAGTVRRLPRILVWSGLFALATHQLFAYDVWWQIAAGRWISTHGFPVTDPFSYAFPGHPWIEPRWLWCLVVWGVHSGLGSNYLILLKLGMLAAVLGLLARAGDRAAPWATTLGLAMVLATAYERFMVRPELVSFVLLALLLLCLRRFRQGRSPWWIYPLPLVQILWCNAHTLWILGPAVLWIVVVADWLEGRLAGSIPRVFPPSRLASRERGARLALVATMATLATLVTPYAFRGVLMPFQLFAQISGGHLLNEVISEFRGPFAEGLVGFNHRTVAYLTVVALSALGFALRLPRLPLGRVLLWAAFLLLSIKAQRNVAMFGIVAAFVTEANLSAWVRERPDPTWAATLRRAANAAVCVYLLVLVPLVVTDRFYRSQGSLKRFGFGVSDNRFPARAMRFVRQEGLPTPVLHALGDGGYVMWEGGAASVYVDGRLEVYGADSLAEAIRMTLTGEALDHEARRTGAGTFVVPNELRYRDLLAALESSADWVPVYFDHLHQVYLRLTPETRSLARGLAIDWSRPEWREVARPRDVASPDWLAGLWPRAPDSYRHERVGSLFAGVGNYEAALAQFETAVAEDPGDPRSRLYLGLFYEALGRDVEAANLWRRVPAAFFERTEVHILSARAHLWAGRPDAAVGRFERALELGAPRPGTAIQLARAALLASDLRRAEAELRRVLEEVPSSHEAWNLLALVAMRGGRPAEAVRAFEASLRIQPSQARVCHTLAGLYGELGEIERAQTMERRAERIDSGEP